MTPHGATPHAALPPDPAPPPDPWPAYPGTEPPDAWDPYQVQSAPPAGSATPGTPPPGDRGSWAADPAVTGDPYGAPVTGPYAPSYGYPPAYGGYTTPYAVIPVQHPRAVPALVMGVLSIVLGMSCGLGGLLGIGGVVMGRAAREEIDSRPGFYSGRSAANAGVITGVIGLVIAGLVVLVAVGVLLADS